MSSPTVRNIKGTGYNEIKSQVFTPEQMDLLSQAFQQVSPDSQLSKLASGDQSAFNQIEAPALKQFGALQGNIASRFSGLGGTGSRNSSGFQNKMNTAASDFAQQLQSNRQNLMRQARQDLMGTSQMLLGQRPYETSLQEEEPEESKWTKWLASILPLAGAGVGGAFGGLPGATLGGQLGASAGQAFR